MVAPSWGDIWQFWAKCTLAGVCGEPVYLSVMGVALGACSRQGFLGIASAIAGSSARKSNGDTPLRLAEKNGCTEIAELLRRGATK
ncbi:MAG: ankyrin repeat domain-containing protein [Oscillatoria princeps RMCB-10]|nr:ankyrin repeat domain-containing protein [Oscillatoria princeps RMCB-10]